MSAGFPPVNDLNNVAANWTKKRVTICLVALGYLQAAIFYWRWNVIPHGIALVCPVCPHMDGGGTNWEKFSSRTLGLATLNAVVLVGAFLLSNGIFRLLRKN